jgi:hypothetical protein
MIPPDTRPGLPTFTVVQGRSVRVHLRFAATSATASIDHRKVAATFSAAKRTISWPIRRGVVLTVSARAAAGDASYVARIRAR